MKSKIYEITFGKYCKARIQTAEGGINVIAAMDGWGDLIENDNIEVREITNPDEL